MPCRRLRSGGSGGIHPSSQEQNRGAEQFMKVKLISRTGIGMLLAGSSLLQARAEQSPASQYVHRLFSPGSAARSVVAAGVDQAAGTPSEWGGGMKGFGRRLGSAVGTH